MPPASSSFAIAAAAAAAAAAAGAPCHDMLAKVMIMLRNAMQCNAHGSNYRRNVKYKKSEFLTRAQTQDTQRLEARKGAKHTVLSLALYIFESQGAPRAAAGPGDVCDSQDHRETSRLSSFCLPRVLQRSHVMAHFWWKAQRIKI
eukprot:350723-Chlamydomonas_euryale.AAC.1